MDLAAPEGDRNELLTRLHTYKEQQDKDDQIARLSNEADLLRQQVGELQAQAEVRNPEDTDEIISTLGSDVGSKDKTIAQLQEEVRNFQMETYSKDVRIEKLEKEVADLRSEARTSPHVERKATGLEDGSRMDAPVAEMRSAWPAPPAGLADASVAVPSISLCRVAVVQDNTVADEALIAPASQEESLEETVPAVDTFIVQETFNSALYGDGYMDVHNGDTVQEVSHRDTDEAWMFVRLIVGREGYVGTAVCGWVPRDFVKKACVEVGHTVVSCWMSPLAPPHCQLPHAVSMENGQSSKMS